MREILMAGGLALFFSLFGTPLLIKSLVRKGYGQFIRDDGPSSHHTKRGTPTMGGIIIIFSVIAAYLIAHLISGNRISTSAARARADQVVGGQRTSAGQGQRFTEVRRLRRHQTNRIGGKGSWHRPCSR